MFIDTKAILEQEGLFEEILKTIDPELAEAPDLEESVKDFKNNLFHIFNRIMQEKMANEDK